MSKKSYFDELLEKYSGVRGLEKGQIYLIIIPGRRNVGKTCPLLSNPPNKKNNG